MSEERNAESAAAEAKRERELARASDRGKEMRSVAVEAAEAALAAMGRKSCTICDVGDRTAAGAVALAVALVGWDAARMSLEAARLRGKCGQRPAGGAAPDP